MKRRLLNLLTALSLLLCIAVCMLWVRSYRYHESLAWPWSSARHAYVLSTRGGLTYFHIPTSRPDQNQTGFRSVRIPPEERNWSFPGTSFLGFRVPDGGPSARVTVPYWFILCAAALGPGLWLIRARRTSRRHRLGHCLQCGYDLRATPGLCPECGKGKPVAISS